MVVQFSCYKTMEGFLGLQLLNGNSEVSLIQVFQFNIDISFFVSVKIIM